MDVKTVDASAARAEEARWNDFASTSTTWHWEGPLRVAEEAMSLLFILALLEAARLRISHYKEQWLYTKPPVKPYESVYRVFAPALARLT